MADSTLQGERIELRYIPLSQAVLWDENPKQHDIGAIVTSIKRYGFIDPPKVDATLAEGGALIYGNGRTHALRMMQQQRAELPRGIAVDEAGEWYVPVMFGLDQASQELARAAAIDHNNLTMSGGDYTALDMARMWDQGQYTRVLAELAEQGADALPVTVDGDDLDLLVQVAQWRDGNGIVDPGDEWQGMPEFDQDDLSATYEIKVKFEDINALQEFAAIIGQDLTENTRSIWYPERAMRPHTGMHYVSKS